VARAIAELLRNFVSQENNWKTKLLKDWGNIIGPLKNKVTIEKIEGKLLVLGVTHPAWAQELFLLSDMLKKKINAHFDKEYIKAIRFKIVALKDKNKDINKNKKKRAHRLNRICLTKEEYDSLSKIKDLELRDSMENFYLCCKRGSDAKGEE
jgi:hypothetical protein